MTFMRLLQLRSVQASVFLLSLVVTAVLYSHVKSTTIHSYRLAEITTTGKTKTILVYRFNRWLDEWVGRKWNTAGVFETCPVSNCVLTNKRTMLNVADAVMYGWDDLSQCRTRSKDGQIGILFEHESPAYTHKPYKACNNNMVNWTWTYRRDSDFTLVHGQFLQHDTGYNVSEMDHLLRSKSKTAVGFISHCKAPSKRDAFVRKLRSYGVDIDIYGKCGDLKCGGERDTKWKGVWNVTSGHQDNCFNVLDNQYKFYLSLENALCKDYVTEKSLHLVLRHQIVPLIRDGANRSIFHPPHSYVDTKNFKSIKLLAEHIKFLSNNFDEYLKFFSWRKHYSVGTVSGVLQSVLCDMCHRMHHQHRYKRLYRNLKHFYTKSHGQKTGKGICKSRLI